MKKSKWTKQQIDLLLEKTMEYSARSRAFQDVARLTNRKPNSVRNFYYKLLSGSCLPQIVSIKKLDLSAHKKQNFAPFEKGEEKNLLREIVLGTSRGESVRSICLKLAKGNKEKMLRYQNKYRAVLAKDSSQIDKMTKTLEAQGFFVKNPLNMKVENLPVRMSKDQPQAATDNIVFMPEQNQRLTDTDINNLFMGLVRLIKKNSNDEQVTGLKNQVDILKAEIAKLKSKTETKTI